jgi:hypothetical protein
MTEQPEKPKKSRRGGKRPGAGRKPGVPDKMAAQHIRRMQAGLELDPWQRAARIMNWWGRRADWLEEKIRSEAGTGQIDEGKAIDTLVRAHEKILECAKELMPYMRPRLSAVKVTGQRLDPSKATDDELSVLERVLERNSPDAGRSAPGEDETRH